MNWQELDFPTRAGFVAGVIAVVSLIVPPVFLASALVAAGFSGVGWKRARTRGEANRVAELVFLASLSLIVVVVAGNLIYAAAN